MRRATEIGIKCRQVIRTLNGYTQRWFLIFRVDGDGKYTQETGVRLTIEGDRNSSGDHEFEREEYSSVSTAESFLSLEDRLS